MWTSRHFRFKDNGHHHSSGQESGYSPEKRFFAFPTRCPTVAPVQHNTDLMSVPVQLHAPLPLALRGHRQHQKAHTDPNFECDSPTSLDWDGP